MATVELRDIITDADRAAAIEDEIVLRLDLRDR